MRRRCRSRHGRAGNERSGHAQVWEEKAGVMQDYQISSGTVSTGITLNDGDTMEVQADGEVISTTAFGGPNWATINVENGGLANDTVLTGAVSVEFVEPGGADTNATVNNGGGLEIEGNASKGPGTGTGATINSGGQLLVDGFGVANTATINKGGNETIQAAGTDNNATLSGGRQFVQGGNAPGVANATTILSGGFQQVTGVANGAQILGGAQDVVSAGIANSTTVSSGGLQEIDAGGLANGTTVLACGTLALFGNGSAVGLTLNNGGNLIIGSGATVNGALISGAIEKTRQL
jgi:autotransporter passenger strand-loop-strand repeat protein